MKAEGFWYNFAFLLILTFEEAPTFVGDPYLKFEAKYDVIHDQGYIL